MLLQRFIMPMLETGQYLPIFVLSTVKYWPDTSRTGGDKNNGLIPDFVMCLDHLNFQDTKSHNFLAENSLYFNCI